MAFMWIHCQNPGAQVKDCSWYLGCALLWHLGVFSQPPAGPAAGQCNSAFLRFHLHQPLMRAESFQAWSTMGPAIVAEGSMGRVISRVMERNMWGVRTWVQHQGPSSLLAVMA